MDILLKYFSDFSTEQLEQFKMLENLYNDWNSRINVISRKDIEGLYEKHVLHSLSIAAVFKFEPGMEILDIGTGGGFPGIPLAIFFPDVKFHLADSIGKKLKVVEAIATEINLRNVTTQHTRAEEIKNTRLNGSVGQGKFDFIVSRAVAPLKDLWKWSKPLLRRESLVRSERTPSESQELKVQNSKLDTFTTHDSRLTTPPSGLICLKGGDLSLEIQESGTRPRQIEISEIFSEEFFKEKYLLFVPR